MQFVVNRESFAEVLTFANEIVKVRTPKPALTAVRIVAEGKRLTLIATDMEVSMRWPVTQVDIARPGDALMPALKLQGIVNSIGSDTITCELTDEILAVKGPTSKFNLFGYAPKDFPPVTTFVEKESDVLIPAGDLMRMIEQVEFAMATEPTRYALNALQIEQRDKRLSLVATNGHMLSWTRMDAKGDGSFGWAVSQKMVKLLEKLLASRPDATCRMQFDGCKSIFMVDDIVIAGSLCEGTFPPYADMLSKDCSKKGVMNRKDLLTAVRQATLLTGEESKGIRLAFGGKMCVVSSRTPERGEAMIDVPCEYTGEAMEIGVNPEYLGDALKPIQSEHVRLEMNSANKPIVVKGDAGAMTLIMPVNLS